MIELEGLTLGVTGKLGLWKALLAIADDDERLDAEELRTLAERAEAQQRGLEQHRLRATTETFTAPE